MKNILLTIIVLVATLSSCYYDKEELFAVADGSNCDTTIITYSQSVVPILTAACLGCHTGASSPASVRLDTYTGVKAIAAPTGMLLKVINHAPGVSPMPKGGTKLSACSIRKIQLWINAGAPDN